MNEFINWVNWWIILSLLAGWLFGKLAERSYQLNARIREQVAESDRMMFRAMVDNVKNTFVDVEEEEDERQEA